MRSNWLRIAGCLIATLLFMRAWEAQAYFRNDAPPPLLPGGTWDPWLDRAREEIAALLSAPVEQKVIPTDIDLGVMLAADRLNDADKALLEDMLKVAARRAPVADESERPLSAALSRTRLLWALGEQGKARAEFALARPLAKDVKRPTVFGLDLIGWLLATQAAELGDYDVATSLAQASFNLSLQLSLYEFFLQGGHRDLADRFLREKSAEIAAMKAVTMDDVERVANLWARVGNKELVMKDLAQARADFGDLPGAVEIVRTMPASFQRAGAFQVVALVASRREDHKLSHELLLAAFDDLKTNKSIWLVGHELADATAEVGDKAVFKLVAAALEQELANRTDGVFDTRMLHSAARLARAYFTITGDRQSFRRLTAMAEAALKNVKTQDQREASLDIAACQVLDGRDADIDKFLAAIPSQELGNSDCFYKIPEAYSTLGKFDRAVEITEKYIAPEDRNFFYSATATNAVRAGRFEVALALVDKLESPFNRMKLWRFIARQQARVGRAEDVEKWLTRIADRRSRAVIELGVAEQLLGKRGTFASKLFKDE
jgi:tetratricopeptide (TPR) repeat protein